MHILEKLTVETNLNDPQVRADAEYDIKSGFWKTKHGVALTDDPDEEEYSTKKNDVETGEDLKGQ